MLVDGETNGFVVTGAAGMSRLTLHGDIDRVEAETLRLTLLGFVSITRYRVELDLGEVGCFGPDAAEAVAEVWEESMLHGSGFTIVAASPTARQALEQAGLGRLVRPTVAGTIA